MRAMGAPTGNSVYPLRMVSRLVVAGMVAVLAFPVLAGNTGKARIVDGDTLERRFIGGCSAVMCMAVASSAGGQLRSQTTSATNPLLATPIANPLTACA